MIACRYGISLLVFNSTSHSFAALTRELSSWTLVEKFHIYARPCIILYWVCGIVKLDYMVTLSTISFLAGFKDQWVQIKNASSVRRRRNQLSICFFSCKILSNFCKRVSSWLKELAISFRFVSIEISSSWGKEKTCLIGSVYRNFEFLTSDNWPT